MKIIVAGPRHVTDYEHVRQAFIHSGYWRQYKKSIEVVSGRAKGVDQLGEEFARRNGLSTHLFPAEWDKHGKAAGPIRNAEMGAFAKANGGLLLAVWDGQSKGTKHMIEWALKNDLKGYVYRIDKPLRYGAEVGMKVQTDFSGKVTKHTIIEISEGYVGGQSGTCFKLQPPVPKSGGDVWIDSDWFQLVP